ncbi:MAG: pyridoxal-phosphate dependent enzyme [Thermoleophilaceae bacterium]
MDGPLIGPAAGRRLLASSRRSSVGRAERRYPLSRKAAVSKLARAAVSPVPDRQGRDMLGAVSASDRVRLRLDRVRGAVGEIDSVFLDTPALLCAPLGQALGCSMTLKIETLNPVRCFKGRGTETVAAAVGKQGASRLVCASAGNLGQALAYSGSRRGLAVTVVGARTASPLKLRQIAAFGAAVRLEGEDIEDARVLAREIAEADGAYLVEDSLDLATCEGAATIGLELVRDDPGLDIVLVALGGGAMASGVGYAVGSLAGHVEVIGIQPLGAPAMALSWRQGTVVETDRIETIADGVAGRCPIPEVLDDLLVVLDDVVLVREDSIKAGMRALHEHAGLVVEPSAALGIAAVLEDPQRFAGRRVTTILCGSNVDPADFARWVLEPAVHDAR